MRALRRWLDLALVAPVREGLPRPSRWPWGLRGAAVWGLLVLVSFAVALVGSGWLRTLAPLRTGTGAPPMPGLTLGLLVTAALTAMIFLVTGLLHAHPVLRMAGILLAALAPGIASSLTSPGLRVALVLVPLVGVGILTLARLGKRFHEVELVAVAVLIAAPTCVGLASDQGAGRLGFDVVPASVSGLLIGLGTLAAPALVAAGMAVPMLVCRAADGLPSAMTTAARGRAWHLGVVSGLVGVFFVGWLVVGAERPRWDVVVPTSLVLALVLLAVVGGLLATRTRSAAGPTAAGPTIDAWADAAWPLGLVLTLQIIPVLAVTLTGSALVAIGQLEAGQRLILLADDATPAGWSSAFRLVVSVAVLGWALWRARRGAVALVLPAAVFVALQAAGAAFRWAPGVLDEPWWSVDWLGVAVVGLGVVALAWAATRGAVRHALPWVTAMAALVVLWSLRGWVGDPLGQWLGSATLGAVVVGLVWRGLTDGEFTRRESRWLPGPTRVLLVMANLVFAASVVTQLFLTRSTAAGSAPEVFGAAGEHLLGTPLYVATLALLLQRAVDQPTRTPRLRRKDIGFDEL